MPRTSNAHLPLSPCFPVLCSYGKLRESKFVSPEVHILFIFQYRTDYTDQLARKQWSQSLAICPPYLISHRKMQKGRGQHPAFDNLVAEWKQKRNIVSFIEPSWTMSNHKSKRDECVQKGKADLNQEATVINYL